MPAARPSQATVSNVLSAMAEQGLFPASIDVDPEGGFVVRIQNPMATGDELETAASKTVDDQPPAYE